MRDLPGDREDAPFYADIAAGPKGAVAHWLTASDGVRIRVARWRGEDTARGTVLMFPGRTEFVEKYGPAAAEFRARGYAMLAVDWRGQGLADRLAANRRLGHVRRFADYQRDVDALLAHAAALDLPKPWFLIGHSMGGAIGLRALLRQAPVKAAVFTAPMWGIRMARPVRPMAWGLSSLSRSLRIGEYFAPGQTPISYAATAPFLGNTLTSDREMFDFMRHQLDEHPELALGGVSLGWLNAALVEMRALMQAKGPDLPVRVYLGAHEAIVDSNTIRRRVANWPSANLITLDEARHEVMLEAPPLRTQVFDGAAELFDAASGMQA